MKWSLPAFIVVIVVLFISFLCTSKKDSALSDQIKERRLKSCTEQNRSDCDFIERYHDECFERSYRTSYKIKQFYQAEYDRCMNANMKPQTDSP